MSESVKMPALGESVTEGTVSSWLKAVGDTVEVDEPLLEVATDKVDTEVPSPVAGTVLEIRVPEDETVEVGTVLAVIGDPQFSDCEFALTTSPRTPRATESALEKLSWDYSVIYSREPINPIGDFLAQC